MLDLIWFLGYTFIMKIVLEFSMWKQESGIFLNISAVSIKIQNKSISRYKFPPRVSIFE